MTARPILVDTTRLLTRLKHANPTGIDRVDLAYAKRYATPRGPGGTARSGGTAATRFGMRLMPDGSLGELFSRIDLRWHEGMPAERDPVLARIRARLAGAPAEPVPADAARRRRVGWAALRPILDTEAMTAGAFRWPDAREAPRNAIYLHTSHLRLERPHLFDWLSDRRDVRAVFFVHDLIPVDYPEYAVPGEAARHRARLDTIARHARAVIANSADVADRFTRFLRQDGRPVPPVVVAPLGVEGDFSPGARAPRPSGAPYFVACSTIEARKNHLLLLQVWRAMAERLGPACPKLVIVGRRGWESEAAIDMLDRCEAIRPHVIEAHSVSTAGLADLVAGAAALLMPSFAEGYGIPVVEALSLGTPVIASDLAVHREIAGGHAVFLSPLDGPGWERAITDAASGNAARPAGFRPPGWGDHFAIVDRLLATL